MERVLGRSRSQKRVIPNGLAQFLRGPQQHRSAIAETILNGLGDQTREPPCLGGAGLEEHIAALDIGPDAAASGIREQASQISHRQQVLAADIDPPQQGHVAVPVYPKLAINRWMLSFSSLAGLYFKASRN